MSAGPAPQNSVTTNASEILDEVNVSIIKGNSSEIARTAGEDVQTRGVDAVIVEKNLQDIARELAKR